jgi:hypothetical protein
MKARVQVMLLVGVLCWVVATSAADGRWVYTYEDDFSTEKAKDDSYDHSIFWPEDGSPPAEPYLFYTVNVEPPGGLGFAGYQGDEARLAYCFPLEPGGPPEMFGVLELDIFQWQSGGYLAVQLSGDGEIWTWGILLEFGHQRIPLASTQGTCYARFLGNGAVIDNLQVRIVEAAEVLYVDDDAPYDPGPGDPSVSDPLEDGTLAHPFDAIQEAIDLVQDGVEIVVADGIYTGTGNKNIDFLGKGLTVRSANGPADCVIDCENQGRGFYFHNAEPNVAVLAGFTITNGGDVSRGAGVYCDNAWPTIANCVITSNVAVGMSESACGGGICCVHLSPLIVNCVIAQNRAESYTGLPCYGGGVYCEDSHPTIADCTIALNVAVGGDGTSGGGVYCSNSSPTITNCILWADTPQEIHVESGSPAVTYCDVLGGWPGTGNINADPQFAGPMDPRLSAGSPCIDAGDNTGVPDDYADLDGDGVVYERTPLDLAGNTRFADDPLTDDTGVPDPPDYPDVVDMGACEFQYCFGDLDGDGDVDLTDLSILLGNYGMTSGAEYEDGDLDGDGDVDLSDLSALLSVYGATCP